MKAFLQLILLLNIVLFSYGDEKLASKEELYEGPEFTAAYKNPTTDNPEFPNVLLIGDSISIGYTVDVRKRLLGKADVYRIPGNGKNSAYGLKNLDKWLKGRKWDVIHFNWGLWDLCYRHPKSRVQGHRDKVNGTITATPEQYRKNMEKIVAKLKRQTDTKLIWCTTTPVPELEAGRKLGDDLKYNKIAKQIMDTNNIQINDLHAHALKRENIHTKKGDVHFTKKGSAYLAEKVVAAIKLTLKTP